MKDHKEILEQYLGDYNINYESSYDYLIPIIEKVMYDLSRINSQDTYKAMWKI